MMLRLLADDQHAGVDEMLEMMRDGRLRQRKLLAELGTGKLARGGHLLNHPKTLRVGESLQHPDDRRVIHTLKYINLCRGRQAGEDGMLNEKVGVVAGASRGCGRGIALALGEAGATVYVTGRTIRDGRKPADDAPGTIEDTAEEVTRRGGRGIAIPVDHTDPEQVDELFARVSREQGRLDLLACAVWGGNERYLDPAWKRPFWEQPSLAWQECLNAGPYAFWLAARLAAGIMKARRAGLIVTITEPILENAFEGQSPAMAETFWHLGHYSINRLVLALSRDARAEGIAVIGLMPGFMKTERVEMHLQSLGEAARREHRYDLAETTEYAGRAVVALASDAQALKKTGSLLYVADLAQEYGFTDRGGHRVGNFYRALGLIP